MKFRSDIVHKKKVANGKVYYLCHSDVGALSFEQGKYKTTWVRKEVTCKNCRKMLRDKK